VKHKVNISLQVLPTSESKHPYAIVDLAIAEIEKSGLKYRVCPFETVMEGDYDLIMQVIKKIQIVCLENGAESVFSNIKMQISKDSDVLIEDKTGKYDIKKGS
jgi:uncharacterized protein YqgV (UPF0045/DUF77 family)